MKKLLFPILSLVLLLTACYDKDIQEINNRLDNIENQKIASISEQIEAIQKTIPLLSEIDEQLSEHILSLEDKSNKEIAALKEVNATLKNQIADLEKFVNDQLSNTTNWANATFATLAQYNSIAQQLAIIDSELKNTKNELSNAISNAVASTVTSMKSWVNEQLTGYYDIAEINAKLEAIDKQIKAGDEENAQALNELKEQLEKSKTELTEAYQKAITEAITNNNGVIDGKIASQIEAVNKRIDSEVDAMNTKIAALEARIKAIEDKLDEILNRKLDIAFDVDNNIIVAPNYTLEIGYSVTSSTNSATVEVTSSADIKAKVVTNGLNGKISITTGDTIDEYSKVIVFVSNGENVIMRSITFEQATVKINNSDTKTIPVEGGTVELSFLTNVECEVVIPSSASSWLTVVPTTRALEERTITLQATANEGTNRSAVVTVKSVEGNLAVQYTINQESNITILNYTTNDGKPLDPLFTRHFSAELAENSYDAATGKGFLKFNGKVTAIPAFAFLTYGSLTWIEIPDSVTSIGDMAFAYCNSLTSVTIPDSVTSIGENAFYGCTSLTSVTIPDSVTEIGGYAFTNCTSLTAFYGKFASADNRCLIIDGVLNSFAPNELTEYTIPDSVTSIGANAFYRCTSLTSVTIPDSVTEIGYQTFEGCTYLTSVTIGDRVTEIGGSAFFNCTSLTSVTIPDSVTSIGVDAFYNCTSLTSVTIGDSVTSIGEYAFCDCTSLTSVTIPDSVTSIGCGAFEACTSLIAFYGKFASADNHCLIVNGVLNSFAPAGLTKYTIPDSVTEIGEAAFCECSSLTSVTIPDSVTEIGISAFEACTSLTSITIPDSVTEIGEAAFCGCSSLKEVYCKPTTPPSGGYDMFYNNASGRKIYVPRSSVDAYKNAQYWSNYADCIVGYDF